MRTTRRRPKPRLVRPWARPGAGERAPCPPQEREALAGLIGLLLSAPPAAWEGALRALLSDPEREGLPDIAELRAAIELASSAGKNDDGEAPADGDARPAPRAEKVRGPVPRRGRRDN